MAQLCPQGKIKSLEQIYLFSMPVKEYQIVEFFLGSALKDEVMKIMPVQKQTRAGQRTRFKVGMGCQWSGRQWSTAVDGPACLFLQQPCRVIKPEATETRVLSVVLVPASDCMSWSKGRTCCLCTAPPQQQRW